MPELAAAGLGVSAAAEALAALVVVGIGATPVQALAMRPRAALRTVDLSSFFME